MVVPSIFTVTPPSAISSYDWFDFAAGAGYKKFYCAGCDINGSSLYFLTTRTMDGDINQRSNGIVNSNVELNFDITFQNPTMVAAGEAIINTTITPANATTTYIIFTLKKVDLAAAETDIGTVTTSSLVATGASNYRRLTKLTTTQTSFGVGEKLRLEVKFYSAGAGTSTIFFDPASRQTFTETGTGATIGSNLTVDVPFRIDL